MISFFLTILQYRGYCTVVNTPTRVCLSVPRASWIVAVNTRDARFRVGDNKINFFIYYEVDGDTSKHHPT